jgi:hypothetical protein
MLFVKRALQQYTHKKKMMIRRFSDRRNNTHEMMRAGLPFVLFSIMGAWVVSRALQGKLKEMEAAQGKASQSLRQAALQTEHDDMMERLNKIVATDFDNTKRIKRPHEILEERRLERERKNVWYRRLYRWAFRIQAD